jgi:FlgD Ig-like domain
LNQKPIKKEKAMDKNLQKRRDFLKTAAAGAIGITAVKFNKVFASPKAWTSGMQINPAIDNKRVICCHDVKMLPNLTAASTSWLGQNNAVNAALVASNMDQMAMMLAQKTTAADAWSTIFQKPAAKTWASVKVAIKTNAVISNGNHPRVAIIKKICDVLVDQFKVLPANIVIYDAGIDNASCYASYADIADVTNTKIRAVVSTTRAGSLNGFKAVTIASAGKPISCVADLVDGNIDILVNVAVCKAHDGPGGSYGYGSCTLCMKNHFGTFVNSSSTTVSTGDSTGLHSIPAICEINKHDAIIGGSPVRQQLCIVDALLSNGVNPASQWDNPTYRIVMGTFAPIVDYCTANNILLNKAVMTAKFMLPLGVTNAAINLPQFLTNFGYTVADVQNSWIEYVPGTAIIDRQTDGHSGRHVQVSLSNSSYKQSVAHITIPQSTGAMRVSILDGRGRLIQKLSASHDQTRIVWDGLSGNGTPVSVGNYLVKISAGAFESTGSIIVSR